MNLNVKLLITKLDDAVASYAGKESDVTVYEAIMALEVVKLNLMHQYNHHCPKCNNVEVCSHCGTKV